MSCPVAVFLLHCGASVTIIIECANIPGNNSHSFILIICQKIKGILISQFMTSLNQDKLTYSFSRHSYSKLITNEEHDLFEKS